MTVMHPLVLGVFLGAVLASMALLVELAVTPVPASPPPVTHWKAQCFLHGSLPNEGLPSHCQPEPERDA